MLGCVGSSLAFEAFDFDFPKKNYIYEQNKYRNQNDVLTIKYKEVKKKKKNSVKYNEKTYVCNMSKPTGLTCSSNQFTHKETKKQKQKQKQSFVVHIYLVTCALRT